MLLLSQSAWGQQVGQTAQADGYKSDAEEEADLAKKTQNPVANLISVPIQSNFDFGTGPGHPLRYTANIQPVIPISIGQDWNLITRIITPVIYQESRPGGQNAFGLGDITPTFFFSPKQPYNGITWGAGPVFLLPTATKTRLGSQKFGLGPSAVVLRQESGWTYGALVSQIWSVAGASHRANVNSTLLQPFLAYTFSTYTTPQLSTEATLNWIQRQWTVPIIASISQIIKIGNQPISLQLAGKYYADRPNGGPDFGLRFTVTLLFPR